MDERAHGLVLRVRPLTDTSLIVHWLSAEQGRLATIAKGARRPKSAFHGKLDLFFEAEFSFSRSRRSDLHQLREIRLIETWPRLRRSLHKIEQLAYCTALIEQTTEQDTPLPEFFALFHGFIRHLQQADPRPRLVYAFELKHLHHLGLEPDLSESKLAPATRELVEQLTVSSWTEIESLHPKAEAARQIRHFLHGYLIYHLDRLPKGRAEALRE
jgi:DNA repair protein RecO